jgi:hypothetical protein
MRKYSCGVSREHCTGTSIGLNSRCGGNLNPKVKLHSTRKEAFKCKCRHLISTGHERVGSREFREPNGGPIVVLTKVSHFGAEWRSGKGGKDAGTNAVPKRGNKSVGFAING